MMSGAPLHRKQRPGLHRAADGWRRDFRQALASTGHSHDSVAAVLGVPRQHVTDMLSTSGTRRLSLEHLDALANDSATRDLWVEFVRLQADRAGVQPVECEALRQQLNELIESARKLLSVLGRAA